WGRRASPSHRRSRRRLLAASAGWSAPCVWRLRASLPPSSTSFAGESRFDLEEPFLEAAVLRLQLLDRFTQPAHGFLLHRSLRQRLLHLARTAAHAPVEITALGARQGADGVALTEDAQGLHGGDAGAEIGIFQKLDEHFQDLFLARVVHGAE